MRKLILAIFMCPALVAGCSHQVNTDAGQAIKHREMLICISNAYNIEHIETFQEVNEYCSCRINYIIDQISYEDYKAKINAAADPSRTWISAGVLNKAEHHCSK